MFLNENRTVSRSGYTPYNKRYPPFPLKSLQMQLSVYMCMKRMKRDALLLFSFLANL